MCQPVRQFVHERQQFLLWSQACAQRNEALEHSAMHALGQSRAYQASAVALNVGL
jgi:hypothetical protein